MQEYAFKENYDISKLFNAIINAHVIAQRCGTDLEHLDKFANEKAIVVESKEALIRKLNNDIEFLPHKLNIDLADYQEYQKNSPIFQKLMNMAVELDLQNRRNKLLEEKVKNLKIQVLERDREIERLNQLRIPQEKKEDGCYVGYQEDIVNLDSTDFLVDNDDDDDGSYDLKN